MAKEMKYRRIGRSGLKVSALSFGSWVTFGPQLDVGLAADCMAAAREAGVNFFDNAEAYSGGESERIMGNVFARLKWPRHSYVISTKLYWGLHDDVNMRRTLNRKYLMQAIDGSLERFGLDFVDILFCHRSDPETPVEETVQTMSDIVSAGKALYWGTSEWAADEIRAAGEISDLHHLHRPVVEQPQYNLLWREKVEREYSRLYEDLGIGLTTWSPLGSGILTGKYLDGVPGGSRASVPGYGWLRSMLTDPKNNEKVRALKDVSDRLGCSLAQMSLAWCVKNPHVSTVITGASRPEQLQENMRAIEVVDLLDDSVMQQIDQITR